MKSLSLNSMLNMSETNIYYLLSFFTPAKLPLLVAVTSPDGKQVNQLMMFRY